ncbi:MAG TPA: hypothetical protein VIT85_07190 [Solirubrobacterales bacterium]
MLRPDGPLFDHARVGFADLRILDSRGKEVAWRPAPAAIREVRVGWPARAIHRVERGSKTLVGVDLGYRKLDVDRIKVTAATGRYDRPLTVLGSNDGRHFFEVERSRIQRFHGEESGALEVSARFRHLRLVIRNGDDPPLRKVLVRASGERDDLLVKGGQPGPYRLLYGNPRARPPEYDFARLPAPGGAADRALRGKLTVERRNPAFEQPAPPPDRRSFVARHEEVVALVLAAVAITLGLIGALALRRPRVSL